MSGYTVNIRPKQQCPNPTNNLDCSGYCAVGSRSCRNCGTKRGTATNKIRRLKEKLASEGKTLKDVRFRLANDFDISTWDPDEVDDVTKFVVEELLKR